MSPLATPAGPDRSWWERLYVPRVLAGAAVIAGWFGIYFAFQRHWLGIVLPLVTTALTLMALRRGDTLARRRSGALRRALDITAARNRELDRLRHLAATLLAGTDISRLTTEVARAGADLLDAAGGIVTLRTDDGQALRIATATGPFAAATGQILPFEGSLSGWVVRQDTPLTCDDMQADPRSFQLPELGTRLTTAAIVPLRSGSSVIGTVSVHNRHDGLPFGRHDLRLLQALGDQLVVGLDRAMVLEASRRNERELVAKNVELERATRLKSEFLANMSHELRTPLNAIIGFSDLLLTESVGPVNGQQKEFLEAVVRNGRHLLGLINSVLDLSKIEAGRMALTLGSTDIREAIIAAVADTASLRAAKHQTCDVNVDGVGLPIVADGVRVRQILFNLLSNASKFTPDGGKISVAAVQTAVPLPVPADRLGDEPRMLRREAVWVTVVDTGIGIQREDMPKLFHEFSQVDSSASRQQQGTGLGLALSKRFVEMHGGVIGADSIYGRGTAVWFILPGDGPVRRGTSLAAGQA